MTAEQQGPRLQQVKICSNATAISTEIKGGKKASPLQKASGIQGSPVRHPCFHCHPLNEVWERVDPGSSPSGHSGVSHAPELPWVGPAFPPGAQSLLQAVTQQLPYTDIENYAHHAMQKVAPYSSH